MERAIEEIYSDIEFEIARETHCYEIAKIKEGIIYLYEKINLDTDDVSTITITGQISLEIHK